MRSGKSSPKKQRRLTALILSLRWKSTPRAPSKRWSTNVRAGLSFFPPSGPPFLGYITHRQLTADQNGMMGSMMQDLAFAIPGVDEAMSFADSEASIRP